MEAALAALTDEAGVGIIPLSHYPIVPFPEFPGCWCYPAPGSDPHFALAGAEVEVEAALEALVDEAGVGGHGAQARESPREEVQAPLRRLLLLPGQLLTGHPAGTTGVGTGTNGENGKNENGNKRGREQMGMGTNGKEMGKWEVEK